MIYPVSITVARPEAERDKVVRIFTSVVLPAPLRPEQSEDGSFWDVEVQPDRGHNFGERLDRANRIDCMSHQNVSLPIRLSGHGAIE